MINDSNNSDECVSDDFNVHGGGGTCSPGGTCYRYLALAFMCFLGFGSYFCFDNPGALQEIITKDMDLSTTEFSYLYSTYSWPNTILCFVGGFLIDRIFGIRLGTALYAFIVFIGQLVVAAGAFFDSFALMLLGRVIFGIGGESLAVAQNYYAVLWFKGYELNMIFGLQLSFARVGSAVNFLVMGHLYKEVHHYFKGKQALGISLLLASGTCLVSFVCSVFLAYMKKKVKPEDQENEKKEVVKLSDIKDFCPPFWMISIICVTYYIAIFPLIALGKVFFMRKFGLTGSESNNINSLLYGISAIVSPLLGYLVDKTGWNIFWLFVSISATIGAHSLLAFTFWNPVYAMVILGLTYSMCASALWPMISLVVPDYQLGTAYGVAQSFQNFGLAIATILAGLVVDNGGYLMLEMFFLAWLFVALITCLCMWMYDINTTGILNMTVGQRAAFEANKAVSRYLGSTSSRRSSCSDDMSPYEVSNPQAEEHIRNRYLTRIGATPVVTEQSDPEAGQIFRTLR